MEFTCAVWFKEALAHYHISKTSDTTFVARLLHCINQPVIHKPPQKVSFKKAGYSWICDNDNQEFVEDLQYTIEDNIWYTSPQFLAPQ